MVEPGAMMAAPVAVLAGAETGEHDKTTLLAVIETLVERTCRISELLERGSALPHGIGTHVQPLDRILGPVAAGSRGVPLRALLCQLAQSALNCRPVLFLLGRQLQPGTERGNARIAERGNILSAGAPSRPALEIIRTLLGIHERSTGNRKRGRAGENCFPHGHLQWRSQAAK